MKKLLLTIIAIVGTSRAAYAQASVSFDDYLTQGCVVVDFNGHLSTATDSYYAAPNFTASLYALPGNVTTTAGLGADAYGYLFTTAFLADGFEPVTYAQLIPGGSANGVTFYDGYFGSGEEAKLTSSVGGWSGGKYTDFDALAIVAWTGTWSSLTDAMNHGSQIGIITFVNPLGPGGLSPLFPDLTGWDGLTPSPAAVANDDGLPDLILEPLPEPSTFALAGLGGVALLSFRRRS